MSLCCYLLLTQFCPLLLASYCPSASQWVLYGPQYLQGCPCSGTECLLPRLCLFLPYISSTSSSSTSSSYICSSVSCPRGCCSFLNLFEQRCHVLLPLLEVLAYSELFSSLSKMAESICDWYRGVHALVPCSPLLLKTYWLCPMHSSHDMHFQIRPDPFFYSKS